MNIEIFGWIVYAEYKQWCRFERKILITSEVMTISIQSGRYSHIGHILLRNSPKEDGWSLECGCEVHGRMGVTLLGSSITKVYHHTVLGASQL